MSKVYSQEVPDSEDPATGWGRTHRSVDGFEPTLGLYDEVSGDIVMTSYENFQVSRRKFGSKPFLGCRPIGKDGVAGPYVWSSYGQIGTRADNFGSGLKNLGLCPLTGEPELRGRGILGLYSKNRLEWVVAEQGAFAQAIVTVPLYDTLGAESVAFVIKQTLMHTIICSAEVLHNVLDCKHECPTLACIIVMESVNDEIKKKGSEIGINIVGMEEVESAGLKAPQKPIPPNPDDILTFCYTSGTTGDPKGVLLTHANMISATKGIMARPALRHVSDDVHLSYLPLPHIFERMIQFSLVRAGGSIGFYQGETLKILEDLQALRPTVFPSVPRLLNRIHDKLRAGVEEAGGMKKVLFDRAYNAKKAGLQQGSVTHAIWDRLVFSKIKERVGLDRVRVLVTGSAPIADHVLDFLRIVFCCPVLEGYGLSETTAGGTLTYQTDLIAGTVGAPASCNEIRLQDIPEMGYLRTDQVHKMGDTTIPCNGRGEICLRGQNIFKGYFKLPDKTAEAIDADGWFHSGDIGMWTLDGRLKIIDRKKNIFKLAQGEYVAPEKIENLNAQSKFVMQNFVHGSSLKTQLVSIIVVDPDAAAAWAKETGNKKSLPELCSDPAFKKAVLSDLEDVGKNAKLAGFEIVKAVHLLPEQWVPGSEVLTPTFKLQRKKAEIVYQADLERLYAELDAAAPPSKL